MDGCGSSKLRPGEFVGGFDELEIACGAWECRQAEHPWGPKRRTSNPHGVAVGTDRPTPSNCRARALRNSSPVLRLWDRLFWILLLRWWPQWRDSLIIVQPETVLRWRRNGWSAIWGYRTRGRWRGGRPRVSSEVRHLITQMARENFLWGAPRIHGELLMLGFTVSQATVSRYLPAPSRRPTQSWRTFLRNQTSAFGQYSEQLSKGYARPQGQYCWATRMRSAAAQIGAVGIELGLGLSPQQTALNARRIGLRSAQCERAAMHRMPRLATVSAGLRKARSNRLPTAVPVRSPPYEARASPRPRSRATREVTFRVDQVLRRHSQEIPALWKFGERESA